MGQTGQMADMSCNDTIAGVVATLEREKNDRSETGGDDYQNPEWLGENRDVGGPGGTGTSAFKNRAGGTQ